MSRDARWKELLELLVEHGRLEVEEAAARLGVSPATIRRDFDGLAEQQMLVRTRGGAVVHGVSYELPLRYKTARRASEKQRIAAAVARLVAPGEAVGLTGGTTTTEVARALAVRPDLASGSPAASSTSSRPRSTSRSSSAFQRASRDIRPPVPSVPGDLSASPGRPDA